MALPRKILGQMKTELRHRLGFASDGASITQNAHLLDDILQASQEALYQEYDFPELRRVVDQTVQAGQRFLDFPSDCESRNILTVAVLYQKIWIPLLKGITTQHDSFPNQSYPRRYDTAQMVELFPIPNQDYTIRFEYKANLLPFTQDQHPCTLDARLVLTYAIVEAKAHYGHQDVGLYQRQLSGMIRNMQSAAHHGNIYQRNKKVSYVEPLPVHV